MASPFATLRKYQFAFFVFFGVALMIMFVIDDPLNRWLSGRTGQTPQSNPVVVTWRGGALTESELGYVGTVRNVLRQFINTLLQETQTRKGTPSVAVPSLSSSEEGIVLSRVLATKAEQAGLSASDEAVMQYLEKLTGDLIPRGEIGEIFRTTAGQRLTEQQLMNELKIEILAQNYANLSYPDLTGGQLPGQTWKYYQRLHRRVKAEIVPVAAANFKNQVAKEPTETEINTLYDKGKELYPDPASPEPGFKRFRKAAFEYVRADRKKFDDEETAKLKPQVTDAEIDDYYKKNKEEFRVSDIPAEESAKDANVPNSEKPAGDKPAGDKPAAEKPATEKPADAPSAGDKPGDKPAEKPQDKSAEKPANEPAKSGDTDKNKPADKPASEPGATPPTAKPETKSDGAKPATDSPPTSNKPDEKKSPDETPKPEGSGSSPCGDDPQTETPKTESAKAESQPKGDEQGKSAGAQGDAKPAAEKPADAKPANPEKAQEGAKPADKPQDAPKSEAKPQDPPKADVKPADDAKAKESTPSKPADGTTTEPKAPGETPGKAASKEAKYKPFDDKLREEIREKIARQKASRVSQERISAAFGDVQKAVEKHAKALRTVERSKGPKPPPPDIKKLAAEKGLASGEIPLSDPHQVKETELGKTFRFDFSNRSLETIGFDVWAYRDDVSLYSPEEIQGDNFEVLYLYWKTENVDPFVPELKDIRAEVVDAWKQKEALVLATAHAHALLEKAKASGKSLKVEFAGDKQITVKETNEFSWMTSGSVAMGMGRPALSNVDGVENAGQEFMKSVFALKPGEMGVAVNQPRNSAYVVQIVSESPAEDLLREMFLHSGVSMDVQHVAALDRQDMIFSWRKAVEEEMAVKWSRQPRT